jgi:RecB family endonuclease NucS
LIEGPKGKTRTAKRLPLGETNGKGEAWLRDTLFTHPEILPIRDVDPSFGPLIPVCRELRTDAGPLDLLFVNPDGKLTLVECKL